MVSKAATAKDYCRAYSCFDAHQVQAEHMGCWRPEDPAILLEELLRADRCADLGRGHNRHPQA